MKKRILKIPKTNCKKKTCLIFIYKLEIQKKKLWKKCLVFILQVFALYFALLTLLYKYITFKNFVITQNSGSTIKKYGSTHTSGKKYMSNY